MLFKMKVSCTMMIWILGQLSFNQPIAKIKLKSVELRSVYLRNTSLLII